MAAILVTGASGFIGSHFCKHLKDEGHTVFGIVKPGMPHEHLNPLFFLDCNIVTIPFDLSDQCGTVERIKAIVKQEHIDAVAHFASQSIVSTANKDPYNTMRNNIVGTLNVLEACQRVPLLLFTTDKVYGDGYGLKEDSPLVGGGSYETSKVCQDFMAQMSKSLGNPVTIVRSTNVFGGGDMNFSRIIPRTILACLKGQRPPMYVSNTTFKRQFVYIYDLMSALHLLFCERKTATSKYIYNIAPLSEYCYGVEYVIQAVAEFFDLEPLISYEEGYRAVSCEVAYQTIDSSPIRSLGWHPTFNLEGGLNQTVNWYRQWWWKYQSNIGSTGVP